MKLRYGVILLSLLAVPAMAQNFGQIPGRSIIGNPGSVFGPARPFDWGMLPRSGYVIDAAADYGAVCDGATNTAAQLQNAINAAQAATGGKVIVELPAGTCIIGASLSVTAPIWLRGQHANRTFIKKTVGQSFNAINVGYQGAEQTWIRVSDIGFVGNSDTGGYAISTRNTGRQLVERILLDHTFCGIEDRRTNGNTYKDIWGYVVGQNCAAFYWHSDPGEDSDQLTIQQFFVNGNYCGNDGLVWEGMAQTLNVQNMALLGMKHGFWVKSQAVAPPNSGRFPGFGQVYNLQVEGAQMAALEIDSGAGMYFTETWLHSKYGQTWSCGTQGSNDYGALVIYPDYGNQPANTQDIKFENAQIGLSARNAVQLNAKNIMFNNVSFRPSGFLNPGLWPMVSIHNSAGYAAGPYLFSNTRFCYGGTWEIPPNPNGQNLQTSYGLEIQDPSAPVSIVGSSFQDCPAGEITGSGNLVLSANFNKNGQPMANQ